MGDMKGSSGIRGKLMGDIRYKREVNGGFPV